MLRIIRDIRPRFIVNENVYGSLTNGTVDRKKADMEAEDYKVWPPLCVPASAVGAIHQRYRIWMVAYSKRNRLEGEFNESGSKKIRTSETFSSLLLCKDQKQLPTPYTIGGYAGFSNRMDRTKGLGNAIVPQVAYEIFKAIDLNKQQ